MSISTPPESGTSSRILVHGPIPHPRNDVSSHKIASQCCCHGCTCDLIANLRNRSSVALMLFPAIVRFWDGSDLVAASWIITRYTWRFIVGSLSLGPRVWLQHCAANMLQLGAIRRAVMHTASPPPGWCSRVAFVSAPRLLSILSFDPAHCETFHVRRCLTDFATAAFANIVLVHCCLYGLLLGCSCYTWVSAPSWLRPTTMPVKRRLQLCGDSLLLPRPEPSFCFVILCSVSPFLSLPGRASRGSI
jgi:hypothetical protein